ncbi:MAG TPA: MFS transporter [Alphaproteobacteria bacterium]|nr:MFS transporter [Alphaproteobacteria bacterium]
MAARNSGWRDLVAAGNGVKVAVFAGGVALTAIEVYIGSTLMPSVVADIGGLELFAWVTTVFIVFSLMASMFAAVRPFGLGPRQNYLIAATAFAVGSLICGLAPSMPVLLIGRAVQGFGGGLLGALGYMMVRLVFPERLWAMAFALASSMWAIATLVGPAIGGVFAEFGLWRWAFFILVPASLLVGLGAVRVVPRLSSDAGMKRVPFIQIGLLILAVLALSVASATVGNIGLAAGLIVLAVAAIGALGLVERRAGQRLLPSGTFTPGAPLALMFGAMLLLQMGILSDIFIPLFMQELHGLGPLVAGYMVALLAVGWSGSSMLVASWNEQRSRLLIACGPVLMLIGAIGLALFVGHANPGSALTLLVPIGLSLTLMGVGIGTTWTHLTPRAMQAAPQGEYDVTSAALSTIQLVGSGMGAALAGFAVNLAGLGAGDPATAANWLYGLWVILPALALPLTFAIVRRRARDGLPQPAE